MAKHVGHICNLSDKYCREGAAPARHPDHNSHMGGCICKLGRSDYAQDMEDAYGNSYKNPAYIERMYDLADMERKRSKGE